MINTVKCTFKWYERINILTKAKKSVKLYIPEDNIIGAFYDPIRNNTVHRLHIPHSSVNGEINLVSNMVLATCLFTKK